MQGSLRRLARLLQIPQRLRWHDHPAHTDLASSLSQVLQTTAGGTTTQYLYGTERLLKLNGLVRTWYQGDALGSVQ